MNCSLPRGSSLLKATLKNSLDLNIPGLSGSISIKPEQRLLKSVANAT
jgi:hypothetical protein